MRNKNLKDSTNSLLVPDGVTFRIGQYATLPTCNASRDNHLGVQGGSLYFCDGTNWQLTAAGGGLSLYQDADYTGTSNSSSAQKFFDESTNGAANVAASTMYHMKAKIHLHTTDADASTVSVLFGGTATLNWIGYSLQAVYAATEGFGTPVEAWITVATAIQVLGSTATAKHITVTYDGHVSIANAGTFIPQYQFGSANQASPVTLRGSWFRLTPVPATTLGNWS